VRNVLGISTEVPEGFHYFVMSKSNRFCFTKNNYTELDVAILSGDCTKYFKYWCFGKEVGENGTPHLQGYFEFDHSMKLRITAAANRIQLLGLEGYHLDIARGTAQQNITYCSKDGDFFEGGERPKGRGKRTDLDDVCALIAKGGSMMEVVEEFPAQFVKFNNGLQKLIQMKTPKRFFKTEVWWLWGPTGSGKSRYAWQQDPSSYMKACNHKWWDGYTGQDVVIMDDFRPSKDLPFNFILNLFDRYPLSVEVKGGMTEFVSKIIYVTTPLSPEDTCNHLDWLGAEQKNQLLRRIDHVIQFPQLALMYSAER